MKNTIITLLLLCNLISYSQDLSNLDKKMGFNKFKLESTFDVNKSNLKFRITGFDKVKYYDYTGNDLHLVFGVFVKRISLGFYKEKLYAICIDFISTDKQDDAIVEKKLIELFGHQKSIYNIDDGDYKYDWTTVWDATRVYMKLDKFSCSSDVTPCDLSLFMISKKMKAEINNDSF